MEKVVIHDEANRSDLPRSTGKTGKKSQGTNFLSSLGTDELFSPEMWKAALIESTATAFLMFALIGSVIACLNSNVSEPSLLVPLAVFINLYLFLMAIYPITGGHMNPLITFICALEGVISFTRACAYIFAQCIGSILGFLLIKSVMNKSVAHNTLLAGCTLNGNGETSGISIGSAFVLEFACAFIELFTGMTVVFDKKRSKELGLSMISFMLSAPMAVAVFVSITMTGKVGYGGVGMNPARCLGPAVLEGGHLWHGHWVFWVGPFSASVVYCAFHKAFPKGA